MPKPPLKERFKAKLEKVGEKLGLRSPSPTPQSSRQRDDPIGKRDIPRNPSRSAAGTPNLTGPANPISTVGNPVATPSDTAALDAPDTANRPRAPQIDSDDQAKPEAQAAVSTDGTLSPHQTIEGSGSSSAWLAGARNVLGIVEKVSEVFPPLKTVVVAINTIWDMVDAFSANQQEFEKLAERVTMLDAILRDRSDEDLPQHVKDRRDGLEISVKVLGQALEAKTKRGILARVAYTEEDQEEIGRLVREITFAIELAMLDVSVMNNIMTLKVVKGIDWLKERTVTEFLAIKEGIDKAAQDMADLKQEYLFKLLGNVEGYGYTRGGHRSGCVPGTRIGLLAQLFTWVENPTSPHAFWLSGIAGVGKTAVTETFCLELFKRRMLGASFFCQLTNKDLNRVYLIFPSLARTLARARPQFGQALAVILKDLSDNGIDPLEMSLQEQYDRLIYSPAESAFQGLLQPVVLCVDAIDECSDREALQQLLDAIADQKPSTPFKVFITSRPEYYIKERIETSSNSRHYHSLRLHDIEDDMVQRDISLYIHRKLENVSVLRKHYGNSWPPPELGKIVQRSGTLFIVAATMVRYIDHPRGDRVERFRSCGRADAPAQSNIEPLYHGILENAFTDLAHDESDDLHTCLAIVVAAQKPLTVEQYAGLTHCRISRIEDLLRPLYSVVDVREGGVVSIYHASFVDCLTKYHPKVILPPPHHFPWTVDRIQAHALMAKLCLSLMDSNDEKRGLFLGVSGAVTSYKSNDDQPHKLTLRADLSYACSAWGDHALAASPTGNNIESQVQGFLERKALYWLEALSVEKMLGSRSTEVLRDLVQVARDKDLQQLLTEIHMFVLTFATPINHCAPHIYLSILPFAAFVLKPAAWFQLELTFLPTVHIMGRSANTQGSILANVGNNVNCIAISPNGRRIVSGDTDGEVQVWDVQSREEVTPSSLEGHVDRVMSVAFSPDGTRLVSVSWDKTVRVWDAETGKPTMDPLEGHTGGVHSVAFSPDGTRIVSGSGDGTIRFWDAESGEPTMGPLEGRGSTSSIESVAFSPDGRRIVSGSWDKTLQVWDAEGGEPTMELMRGHTKCVSSVAFSPNGTRIVSGSWDETVRVWDAESGEQTMEPLRGHTDTVSSVAFSPDGTRIVSGSWDKTIRVWDAESGEPAMLPLEGHTEYIWSVVFTPDGTRIVSGSWDKTIRVWDGEGDEPTMDTSEAHTSTVFSVAFSPDGARIVSGSSDGTVRVWDAESGRLTMGPLEGHTSLVHSVAFSPDGTRIVSGSWDGTIRVWDAESGRPTMEPLEEDTSRVHSVVFSPDGSRIVSGLHTGFSVRDAKSGEVVESVELEAEFTATVFSVAFSPDGTRIVTGARDSTVRVWDAESSEPVLEPFEGHEAPVYSVAFSLDGTKIVSGGADHTVRVWDAESGQPTMDPLRGHTSHVCSVAFSPDGTKIVSGALDHTVRVWDTDSGKPMMEPLQGHTGGVHSVAFSPDGTRIVSGSEDKTIWIRDVGGRQTMSPPRSLHHFPSQSLAMSDSGWICNTSGDLLIWIPSHLRSSLRVQPLQCIIGSPYVEVDITRALYHGLNWRRCLEAHQDGVTDGESWPVEYAST